MCKQNKHFLPLPTPTQGQGTAGHSIHVSAKTRTSYLHALDNWKSPPKMTAQVIGGGPGGRGAAGLAAFSFGEALHLHGPTSEASGCPLPSTIREQDSTSSPAWRLCGLGQVTATLSQSLQPPVQKATSRLLHLGIVSSLGLRLCIVQEVGGDSGGSSRSRSLSRAPFIFRLRGRTAPRKGTGPGLSQGRDPSVDVPEPPLPGALCSQPPCLVPSAKRPAPGWGSCGPTSSTDPPRCPPCWTHPSRHWLLPPTIPTAPSRTPPP